ncbi:AfsR/SARP family transcriptional regulator, partial [Streptomyces sp. H39-S7]|uniref:AfsR/SARP family transcriptional regulator n=1 Tax=Streptomyces sp. H39-S7 TaxID=3004357 RepID=UPI0022AF6FAF
MKEIRLLGEQRIVAGQDSDATPQSSRAVALLGYLVLRAGMAQSRRHLAAVFWPDSAEAQARTNLRRELHHLRILLGPDPSLVIGSATLGWVDSPSCRVDVRVFGTERAAAMSARATGDRIGFLTHAAAAIGEYRGDLAPGSFDSWIIDERERLRRECVDLCDLAVTGWLDAGDPLRAVEVARFRIRLEPHEEAGYRRLMDLQMESGDRAAAMSTYHRCASVLEQELDMTPSPDTLVRAVDELWRHRILRVQPTGYDFSHDLLRDAAYASVTPARRWLLHRRLAQGVELLHRGGLDEVAATLAEQYDRGGRPDRALDYFARAAEVAAGMFAHAEAVRLYRRCLVLAARLSGRDRDVRELDLLQAMSAPLTALQGYSSPEVQKAVERSVALAERLNRPPQLLAGLVGLWAVYFVQGRM